MSRSIAFMIQKGGVGKTSVCGNLAYILSQEHRVLLIDADPQGSLTSWLYPYQVDIELVDFLEEGDETSICKITDLLHILPTIGTRNRLRHFADTSLEQSPFIFRDLIEELGHAYDYIIIDTAPSTSRLERGILLGVDEVVTPLTPEYFSVDGIQIFQEFFETVKRNWRNTTTHSCIVINGMNQSYAAHKGYHTQLLSLENYNIVTIPQDRNIANAQVVHKPVLAYRYFTPCKKALMEAAYFLQGVMHNA